MMSQPKAEQQEAVIQQNVDITLNKQPTNTPNEEIIITHYQRFFHNTLESVRENQEKCKQYWSKKVFCKASLSDKQWIFRGEYECCDTKGWIGFRYVKYEKCPPDEDQFLTGMCSVDFCHVVIDEIRLIENEDEKSDFKGTECFVKSIKNELFDVVRLKMIENALCIMTSSYLHIYPDFEPFDIKYRKQYLKASTKESIKRQIAQNILTIKIPHNLQANAAFTTAFQSAIYDYEYMHRRSHPNYNLNDALSLLQHYHQLWIQHIHQNNKDDKNVIYFDEKETETKFNKSYINWDHYHWNLQYTPTFNWYQAYNSENVMNPPIYSKVVPLQHIIPDLTKKWTVYIESIWPYYFVGVYTKLKKNNPDWRCMKCFQESTVPYLYTIMDKMEGKIYFYKCVRTDVNIEICELCVRSLVSFQQYQCGMRKCNKLLKRKNKRLTKKLEEYKREGIPYTAPPISTGMGYYTNQMGYMVGLPITGLPHTVPFVRANMSSPRKSVK